MPIRQHELSASMPMLKAHEKQLAEILRQDHRTAAVPEQFCSKLPLPRC
jgi:hypothetical protein